MARKSIVETYSKKPVSKRVDIIINNFSIFEDIIRGEEECLYVKIRREQEECLAELRTDLGVKVQTSRISDLTGDMATANADVRSGIENGDWRLATKGTKNYGKYKNAIETLQLMRDDYTIVRGKLKGIRDDDHLFRIYLAKEKTYDQMADDMNLSNDAIRARIYRFRTELKERVLDCMEEEAVAA